MKPIYGAKPLMQFLAATPNSFSMNPRHWQPAIDHARSAGLMHVSKLLTIAWLKAGLSDVALDANIDKALDAEPGNIEKPLVSLASSSKCGAMALHPGTALSILFLKGNFSRGCPFLVRDANGTTAAAGKYELLTPPGAVKVLEAGYPLELHQQCQVESLSLTEPIGRIPESGTPGRAGFCHFAA
ncbi:MAG: hypothetical protein IPK05_19390 [Comamonadaceae bacterium]|nr:hypothetical protein [Comamonadaceae bacterium]